MQFRPRGRSLAVLLLTLPNGDGPHGQLLRNLPNHPTLPQATLDRDNMSTTHSAPLYVLQLLLLCWPTRASLIICLPLPSPAVDVIRSFYCCPVANDFL